MGVNNTASAPIYSEMLSYRKFPEDMFVGSSERVQRLRAAMQAALGSTQ
jgi:hypothetical protein